MSDSAYELFGGDCMKPDFMKLMNRLDFMKLTAQTLRTREKKELQSCSAIFGKHAGSFWDPSPRRSICLSRTS